MAGTGMVEYAKSSRSTCKQCAVKIDKGVLRVGSTTKGPGGIDMTKWYHPNCYFASEGEKGPVEKLAGLSLVNATDKALLESLATAVTPGGMAVGTKREHEGTLDGPTSKKAAKGVDGGAVPATPELGKDSRAKAETYDRKVWDTLLTTFSPSKLSNTYKGAVLPVGWKSFQTVIIGEFDHVEPSSKIAAFDFDGCLVKTDIRRHGADAWSLRYPGVPEQLQKYHKEGYKLVIFTNESNIDAWSSSRQKAVDSKIGRLTGFVAAAGVPMQVFIACGKSNTGDACRKPAPGMWDVMERLNGGIPVNREASLFVGDAAGRPTDFSNSDREFAANVGVRFMVPEHVFM